MFLLTLYICGCLSIKDFMVKPEWYNTEVQYARQMRDKFKKLDMWAEYKFWRNRTKQILDEAKKKILQ